VSKDIIMEARNTAGNYFRKGYNCAESIFLTFKEKLAPGLDSEAVRMFTGFGGGFGHAGCVCGALAASCAMICLVKGRVDTDDEKRLTAYDYVKRFHDKFEEKFGGTCCRVLNPHEYDSPEHLRNCLKITGNTAKLLMEYLLENGLYKVEKTGSKHEGM